MSKHYYIYSDNPKHSAVFTKGLRRVSTSRTGAYLFIEFHYKDGYELRWYCDDETLLDETFKKLKKCLPEGKNIDNDLKL